MEDRSESADESLEADKRRGFFRHTLAQILQKLGAISATQTVMIMCGAASEHKQLIEVLDRCSQAQLTNLSVVSMD